MNVPGTSKSSAADYSVAGTESEAMDLSQLQQQFKKLCPDYMTELDDGESLAVEFCERILFEVGPESRKVKKASGDKIWKFTFKEDKDGNEHVVFVTTRKIDNAEFKIDHNSYHMTLTVNQAALIAHETLERIVVKIIREDGKTYVLTPLAEACFCQHEVPSLAFDLGEPIVDVILKMNQSTQRGGEVLKYGDVDFAICAAKSTTKNLKDEELKKKIVSKITEKYILNNKMPDRKRMEIIQKYANGGFPARISYEKLLEIFNRAHAGQH